MRAATERERLDDPGWPVSDIHENLRDLSLINRLSGAHAIVRRYLDRVVAIWRRQAQRAQATFSVLDVGTGAADVPCAVAAWGRRRQIPVWIVGVDRHPAVVRAAAARAARLPRVAVVQADAAALPFDDASFDVCLCSLTLHHLGGGDRLALLRRLHALARLGFLVVDLLRCPGGYAGVWMLTRLSRNPLTRHDGPLSVRRAMSWSEYRQCAREAQIRGMRLTRLPFFRAALLRIGPPPHV